MNKHRLFSLFWLIALFGLSSCTRCLKCTEKNSAGTVVYDYPEICGDKEDIEAIKVNITSNQDPGKKSECIMRK